MILVFGKTGQIAQELQSFNDVISLDRLEADLTAPEICSEAIYFYRPSAVINAAAYTAVDKAEDEEELAIQINGIAPTRMAQACADLKIPFVHISTDYVFDGTGQDAWKPSDLPNPQNVYGRSKYKGELAISETGANYVILRTSWVVSSHGNNFIKTMLRISEKKKSISVVSDQVGAPTLASDIAKACVSMAKELTKDNSKSGIYHLSGTPNTSWCDFANVIFKKLGSSTVATPISTSKFPTQAKRPLNSRLDCSDIKETFNINRPDWREGLGDILKALRKKNEKS